LFNNRIFYKTLKSSVIITSYNELSAVERVNGRLKDDFGARVVRVRGNSKVMAHLMFGVIL